jgi:hypothetical protein
MYDLYVSMYNLYVSMYDLLYDLYVCMICMYVCAICKRVLKQEDDGEGSKTQRNYGSVNAHVFKLCVETQTQGMCAGLHMYTYSHTCACVCEKMLAETTAYRI